MPIEKGILVAIFCMVIVIAVLGLLSVLIRVFSSMIRAIEGKMNSSKTNQA